MKLKIQEKNVITSEPDITTQVLGPDDQFIVMGSDGLYDFMTNQVRASSCSRLIPRII